MTAITVDDLMLQRPGGFRLGPLSLRVAAGTRTALVGPSGCGKTTLLRCLAGLETAGRGTVRFGDRVVSDPRPIAPPSTRRIGFVFQQAALWPHMRARDHLRFVAPRLKAKDADALLEQVGIGHLAGRKPAELSGGEAQRLALARALAGNPRVLLLDEPLQSVDVHLRDELRLLLRRLAEERELTTILVTHDRDDALAVGEHLVVLRDGAVVEEGEAASLLQAPRTAWTASFLCGAASFPVERRGNVAATLFGPVAVPAGGNGALSLVLLPGDVAISEGRDGPRARVLQVTPTPLGPVATIELSGHTLRLPCSAATVAGSDVVLELRGEPRVLPQGTESET